jgi:exopolysaccharide biosynthesis polyprenyl glycosylphosphotransferase
VEGHDGMWATERTVATEGSVATEVATTRDPATAEATATTPTPTLPAEEPSGILLADGPDPATPVVDPPASETRLSWWPAVRMLLVLTDATAIGLALVVGLIVVRVRLARELPGTEAFTPQAGYLPWELMALLALWLVAIASSGGYSPRNLGTGDEEYRRVVHSTVRALAMVSVLGYFLGLDRGRLGVVVALAAGFVLLVVGRYLTRRIVVSERRKGRWHRRVLLVGDPEPVEQLLRRLRTGSFAGLSPTAICLAGPADVAEVRQVPVLGSWDEAGDAARRSGADLVVVAGGSSATPERIRRLAWELESTGVDLVVSTSLTDVAGPRISVRPVAGLPLLYVDQPTLTGARRAIKRILDVIGSVLALVVLSPLLLLVAGLIRVTSPGPALFRQIRIGQDGREFQVFKFRTMYPDAEERLVELLGRNESDGLLFKMRNDPRVTPIGRFLRATSIDEFPQLLNVLVGQMSLVGPRPLPVKDSDFTGEVRRRLLVRPGITGLWQVSGRSEVTWQEAVRLDLMYVENWSLSLDLLILARTVIALLARRGAY